MRQMMVTAHNQRWVLVLLSLCALAGTAAAADGDLFPLRFKSGSADFALKPGEWSRASGGVEVDYEQAVLAGDSLRFLQSPVAGSKQAVLERFLLEPGPAGPSPDRVLIDNSRSQLANVGFRGHLTPHRVEAVRQPAIAGDKQVRFRVELSGLDYFTAEAHDKDGWVPYAGWADHAQIAMIADLSSAGLSNYRFEAIHLYGVEGPVGEPFRQAKIVRLNQASSDPAVVDQIDAKREKARLHDNVFSMLFDEHGNQSRFQTTENSQTFGNYDALMRIEKKSRLKRE